MSRTKKRAGWAAAAGVAGVLVMAAPAIAAGPTYPIDNPLDCREESVCVWQRPRFEGRGVGHEFPDIGRCYLGPVGSVVNLTPVEVLVFEDSQCESLNRPVPSQAASWDIPGQSWLVLGR